MHCAYTATFPACMASQAYLWEVLLDHGTNVLGVVEVQRSIHLVKDVDGGRLEPERSTSMTTHSTSSR